MLPRPENVTKKKFFKKKEQLLAIFQKKSTAIFQKILG